MIARSYKTRIYPSQEQIKFLLEWANGRRGIWNYAIREGMREWEDSHYDYDTQTKWEDDGGSIGRPIFRETPIPRKNKSLYSRTVNGPLWMQRIPGAIRGQTDRQFNRAWKRYSKTGHKPVLHRKDRRLSFSAQGIKFVDKNHIRMISSQLLTSEEKNALSQPIRLAEPIYDRIIAGQPKGWNGTSSGHVATISYEAGKWYASFPTANHHPPAPRDGQIIKRNIITVDVLGIDANCGAYVCSDGTRYDIPQKLIHLENIIETAHRNLSRCTKGSKRREKAKHRLRSLYAKQKRIREDWLDKITYDITIRSNNVVIERLKIENMTRSSKGTSEDPGKNVAAKSGLNRSILRASWGKFKTKLEYKCKWYSKNFYMVNPAYTSQDCSSCGNRQQISLNVRIYNCPNCGMVIDRDLNAAINIKNKFIGAQGTGIQDDDIDSASKNSEDTSQLPSLNTRENSYTQDGGLHTPTIA